MGPGIPSHMTPYDVHIKGPACQGSDSQHVGTCKTPALHCWGEEARAYGWDAIYSPAPSPGIEPQFQMRST